MWLRHIYRPNDYLSLLEFRYVKVADIFQFSECEADSRPDDHVEVLYAIDKTAGADFLKALGLENGVNRYTNADALDASKYYYADVHCGWYPARGLRRWRPVHCYPEKAHRIKPKKPERIFSPPAAWHKALYAYRLSSARQYRPKHSSRLSQVRDGRILKEGVFGARERDTQRLLKPDSLVTFLPGQESNTPSG